MKSFNILLVLLFFFSLQSCGGGDGGYITIDLEKQNETNKPGESQNNNQNVNNNSSDEEDDKEGEDYEESGNNQDSGNNNSKTNEPIPTTPNANINSSKAYLYIDEISTEGIAHQSAACYGDYAFFISNKMIHVMVYNMKTNQRIFYLTQDPLGTGTIYHCNQACFGTQKYSEEDPFPLLYISQHQNKSNRSFIQVFRVLPTSAGYGQEYTAFAFEKIQTIYFPVLTDDNSLGNVNAVIDTDNHFIYTYSRNNNTVAENYRKCKISKFHLPDALESTSITLSDDNIIDSFFIDTSAFNMQGGAYHDGLLYIGRGAPSAGYVNLYVIDLSHRRLWFSVDLLTNRYFCYEPEGAYFYKDDLYIGASSRIFKFTFKYENSSAKAIAVPFDMPE